MTRLPNEIIGNIFEYENTKYNVYDNLLVELNLDFHKLKQRTSMCSICHQNDIFQYRTYDISSNKMIWKFECNCLNNDTESDIEEGRRITGGIYVKQLLWVHNAKYITRFKKKIFKLFKIKKKYPQHMHKFILHLSSKYIKEFTDESVKIIQDFVRKYVLKNPYKYFI